MERSVPGPGAHEFVLSNLSPSAAQRRLALGVVLAYGTAIFVTDSITAALLFARSFQSCARARSPPWRMAIS